MGGGASKGHTKIIHVLPHYYIANDDLTAEEHSIIETSWELITKNSSLGIAESFTETELRSDVQKSKLVDFYDLFYERLFDVHPSSIALFRNMNQKGKMLVGLIETIIAQLNHTETFATTMRKLAVVHAKMGVMAYEYGIVGDVLFWTLEKVLGEDYRLSIRISWIKLYSKMLSEILPVALVEELKVHEAKQREKSASMQK